MKKVIIALLLLTILFSLSACSNSFSGSKSGNNGVKSANFDLSNYDAHGELSCGRILVWRTTDGNWNSAKEKQFAYLDVNENVIYGWKTVEEFWPSGHGSVLTYTPYDFVNNFAMIKDNSFEDTFFFIDINGNVLHPNLSIQSIFGGTLLSGSQYSSKEDYYITDFDENCYAYFSGSLWINGSREVKGVFYINKDRICRFDYELPLSDYSDNIMRIDNYFFINSIGQKLLFDDFGNLILDFYEDTEFAPNQITIINDKCIEASFVGKDDKNYTCIVDFSGNIIKEPILTSKYTHDADLDIIINTIPAYVAVENKSNCFTSQSDAEDFDDNTIQENTNSENSNTPVNLFELNYEQGHEDNHTREKGPVNGEDCDGNTYTNCYEMHSSMSEYTYLIFDLDKEYSKFTGTFYWSSEHSRNYYNYAGATQTLYIYNADGSEPELLYEVTLNCYSDAVDFSVDVSGIDKLEVANYC